MPVVSAAGGVEFAGAAALAGCDRWTYNWPYVRAGTAISGRSRGRPGRRTHRAASLAEDARLPCLSGAQSAVLSPGAPLRAALGDSGRPARLLALEPLEAATTR